MLFTNIQRPIKPEKFPTDRAKIIDAIFLVTNRLIESNYNDSDNEARFTTYDIESLLSPKALDFIKEITYPELFEEYQKLGWDVHYLPYTKTTRSLCFKNKGPNDKTN